MPSNIAVRVLVDTPAIERAAKRLAEVAQRENWPEARVLRVARRLAKQVVASARYVTVTAPESD